MFLYREKAYLKSFENVEDVSMFFPEHIVEFLRSKRKLHLISNRVCYNLINNFIIELSLSRLIFVLHLEMCAAMKQLSDVNLLAH